MAVAGSFPASGPSSIESRLENQGIPLAMVDLDGSIRLTVSGPGTVCCNSAMVPTQAAAISQAASRFDSNWDMEFLPTKGRERLAWHDSEIQHAQWLARPKVPLQPAYQIQEIRIGASGPSPDENALGRDMRARDSYLSVAT